MVHDFDRGYPRSFDALLRTYPGAETYPPADFRVEWGPVFHRGRLDGSARVLVLGQDPAAHETITRRILVGEAGQRVQGLLAKVGIDRSYVMINTFLYSVYGQQGGERHRDDPAIAAYRHRWLGELARTSSLEAIVALGHLADAAYEQWRATPTGETCTATYVHLMHPTYPESVSAGSATTTHAEAMEQLMANWNRSLPALAAAVTPDVAATADPYGASFAPDELVAIPERDLPPGLPAWMRALDSWASRRPIGEATGASATPADVTEARRAGLGVRVPREQRVWHTS